MKGSYVARNASKQSAGVLLHSTAARGEKTLAEEKKKASHCILVLTEKGGRRLHLHNHSILVLNGCTQLFIITRFA